MTRRRAAATWGWLLWAAACRDDPPATKTEAAPPPRAAAEPRPVEHPTFATHVAPLVHAECAPCHHEGGSAPFALVTYDDVRDHATQIAEVTARGFMPPWLPEPGYGDFVGERRLDETQRALLARWAQQDAPSGDLAKAPAPPKFDDGFRLGPPDLVLDTGDPFVLPADGTDVYRNFVLAVPGETPRFVQAVEILPGDPTVVHHAVMRVDFTGSVRRLDEADPAPGFDGMVFGGARMPDGRFIGWTPGRQPDPGDPDRAWRLLPGSDLVLQLHLRPSGKPEPIAAKVGLHLAEHPPRRAALAIELSSTRIDLPAGAKGVTVEDRYQLPIDAAIRSVYPHAHYLGTKVEGWAELPDGSKKWLVKIDDWDFDWQDEYRYRRAVSLPAGSTLHMAWTFDNSADNPHNPSSPPVDVHYGQSSTDEMAELIVEVEPTDPREIAALDRDFQRKWLRDQAATIERMLAANPDDVDRIADLAALRQLAGDTDAAIETYQRALQADAGHARSLHELGIAYLARKQVDEAIAVLRRAVAAAPEDAGPHLVLANALRKSGDDVAAIAEYRRALALDDANANAHNNLGIVLEARGDHEGAITHFTRATELVPTQALFQRNLARAQTKTK